MFSSGSGTVDLGEDVTTIGLKFDTTGYTIASAASHVLTLSPNTAGNVVTVINSTDTATISAAIAGTTGLTKAGDGTLVLSGTNTFGGDVTVSGGTVTVTSDAALGTDGNGIALNTGTFKTATNLTIGSGRTLSGGGTIDVASGATLTFTGPVNAGALNLPSSGTVALSNASVAFTSATVAAGATLNITGSVNSGARTTFYGDGNVILAGDNSSYGSGFSMSKGTGSYGPTVTMTSATSLGGAQLFLNAGTLNAASAMTGANAIANTVSFGGNATLMGADMEFTNAWTFFSATQKTLTVQNNVTFKTGIVAGASGVSDKLIKAGSGTLTLTVANSYVGGTAVIGGKLVSQSGAVLGTGDVTVTPTSTANSTLELHDNASIASTANVILSSLNGFYGVIDMEFIGTIQVNTLQVNGTYLAPGLYSATNEPGFFTGTGSMQVLAVPEPSTIGLLALAGGGILLRRRKLVA
ncbi:MAG: autotransporter-associated beta strand repeat-containing protein [Chthoniobacteraceae bacterium]